MQNENVISVHAINGIAKENGVSPSSQEAIDFATRTRDLYAKNIKAKRKCSDEESIELAIRAINAQYAVAVKAGKGFFPPHGSRRWELLVASLEWMLMNRHRDDFSVKELANYLFYSGLFTTPSGKPEARGIGDALGAHGLRLKKQSGGVYAVPTEVADFAGPEVLEEIGLKEGENILDALCRHFHVQVVGGESNA